ncbi:MAG: S41 family peptidase [Bacteroidia bacterium]
MRLFPILFFLVFLSVSTRAQKLPPAVLSPAQMQEDLDTLRSVLFHTPTDPFSFISRAHLEAWFQAIEDSTREPRSPIWFYHQLNPLVVSLKDIHTRISLPWSANPYARSGGYYIPLKIRYLNQRVYVTGDAGNHVPTGSELIAINGIPAIHIVRKLLSENYSDGDISGTRVRLMEEGFASNLPLFFPPDSINALQIRPPESNKDSLVFYPGVRKTAKPRKTNPGFGDLFELRLIPEDQTAVLRIGSFVKGNELRYRTFLRKSFRGIRKAEVSHLIIDVRGNKGGYIIRGPALLAYIAEKPFFYAYTSIVRASPLLKKNIRKDMLMPSVVIPVFKKWVGKELVSGWKQPSGNLDTLVWEATRPKPERLRFSGETFLLTDELSISNSCMLHHAFAYNDMGKTIGATCGCIESGTFGNSVAFTLPHSQIRGKVSTVRLITRPEDLSIPATGLAPDIVVEDTPESLFSGKDTQLDFTLQLIRSQ